VAERADRWNTVGGRSLTPEERLARVREDNALLDAYCAAAGRDTVLLLRLHRIAPQ
jgi:alkanesulfonate monooxygenase SsuD/methylene tetrahydromethanopterin reductase-like flavin-dependent oxidoreductase (luciferase family)